MSNNTELMKQTDTAIFLRCTDLERPRDGLKPGQSSIINMGNVSFITLQVIGTVREEIKIESSIVPQCGNEGDLDDTNYTLELTEGKTHLFADAKVDRVSAFLPHVSSLKITNSHLTDNADVRVTLVLNKD